jgi:hypothetical protein
MRVTVIATDNLFPRSSSQLKSSWEKFCLPIFFPCLILTRNFGILIQLLKYFQNHVMCVVFDGFVYPPPVGCSRGGIYQKSLSPDEIGDVFGLNFHGGGLMTY